MYRAHLSEIISSLKNNKISVSEYISETCRRIDEREHEIQALLPEEGRLDRLLEQAEQLENRFNDSHPGLFGVLIGVKDIFRADGFPTHCGSRLPSLLFDGPEASCVTTAKDNGALVLGKTVTTEFAFYAPGPTRNPYNIAHTPGGSSSGSAAAVAAGFCPLAFGTQTIGSITRPAAFCGVIGYKPSYGRISAEGVIPFSWSADHIGLFTQDVQGMIIAASVFADHWKGIFNRKNPVFGIPDDAYLKQASPRALSEFEEEVKILEKAGYAIRRVPLFENIDELAQIHRRMIFAEMYRIHRNWFHEHEGLYQDTTADVIRTGMGVSATELNNAINQRISVREHVHNVMKQEGISFWICPSAPDTAPEGIHATGNPAMNLPWTYTGIPTVTVPSGTGEKGLPYGIQIAAAFMDDETLLSESLKIEKILYDRFDRKYEQELI